MRTLPTPIKIRLNAAALLLLFVLGLAAPQIVLAQPQLHGCTMECCQEEGFCCCIESRREASASQSDSDEIPQLSELVKKCGSTCATGAGFNSVSSLIKQPPEIRIIALIQTQNCTYQSRIEYQEYLRLKKSSPRAPPRFS